MAIDSIPTETAFQPTVQQVYDGSSIYFQLLRACGWGTLMNLGYSRPWDWVIYPFRADIAQERLVQKSIALVQPQDGQQVLDVACGKGKSSFFLAMQNPTVTVMGLDKIASHVQIAQMLFGGTRNLTYEQGEAEALPCTDQSFDRIHCLEAAFHFKRDRFLQEAHRILKPGGRAVIVDFMWKTAASRQIFDTPEGKLIQQLWQCDDLWTIAEYHQAAQQAGFDIVKQLDWTAPVTGMSVKRMDNLVQSCKTPESRVTALKLHPPLKYFSEDDWQMIRRYSDAHKPLHQASQYIALILEKG